jgi:hypothetical protein
MKYQNSPFKLATQNSSFVSGNSGKCCQRLKWTPDGGVTKQSPKTKMLGKSVRGKASSSTKMSSGGGGGGSNWMQAAGLLIQGVSVFANLYLGLKNIEVANKQGAAASSNDRNNTWIAKENLKSQKNRIAQQAQYQMNDQSIKSEAYLKSLYSSSGGLNAQMETTDYSPNLTYYDWNSGTTKGFKEAGRNEKAYNDYQAELKKIQSNKTPTSAFAAQAPAAPSSLGSMQQSAMATNAIGGPDTSSQIVTKPGAVVRKKSLGAEPQEDSTTAAADKELKDKKNQLATA